LIRTQEEIYHNPITRNAYKQAFFEGIGHNPHPGQQLIHYDPYQYHVAVWGRRAGKTEAAAHEAIEEASWSGRRIWVVAPTYVLTDKVFRVVYHKIVNEQCLGPKAVTKALYNPKGDRRIELVGGGFIEGKSAESPKSLLGEGLDLIILDEAAQTSLEIWETYLEPTLADREGRALFITTPRGYNWIHKLWREGMSEVGKEEGWRSTHICTKDNPYLSAEWIEKKRRRTDPATFRQEYEASFEAKKGVVYSEYTDTFKHQGGHRFNVSEDEESYIYINPNWTHYRAIDPGLSNPTACIWAAVSPKGDVYVYDEYEATGGLVKDHAQIIVAKTRHPILTTYIDPAAARRNDETGHCTQDHYAKYGIYTVKATNDLAYGVGNVKEYFRAGVEDNAATPAVYISERCHKLRVAIIEYEWDPGRTSLLEKNEPERPRQWNDHLPDALRYLLAMNPKYIAPQLLRPDQLEQPVTKPDEARWAGRPKVG
jgi:hypothetical protein